MLIAAGHLELDLRELLGRLADLAKERQPARIAVDARRTGSHRRLRQARVLVLHRLVEPFERQVGFAAQRVAQAMG